MTKKKTKPKLEEEDPHVLVLREHCLKTADMIIQVVSNKPHVTDKMRQRLADDLPELTEIINKAPLWPGHLSMIKKFLDDALMKATQIDVKPSVPMANAYYPGQVSKVFRKIIEATFTPDADKTLRRLHLDDINAICPMAGCGKLLLYRDKHGNVPAGRKKSDVCSEHSRAIKAQAIALQAHREQKTSTRKKAAKREAKENRGKPDPEYIKAMEKRKKALRDKEGTPSREERRKSRGF